MLKKFIQTILIMAVVVVMVLFFSFWVSKGWFKSSSNNSIDTADYKMSKIIVNGKELKVMLADTVEKQIKGLSGLEKIGEDEGMLFIFPYPTTPSFWMKDMKFSIDIIWIDPEMKIIKIDSNILPETYPNKFSPQNPVLYVLEVKASWSEKNGVGLGDKIKLN